MQGCTGPKGGIPMKKKATLPRFFLPLLGLIFCLLPVSVYGYSTESYLLPDGNFRYYEESEIADMSLQIVCYAKNEIYARHGRTFVSKELQRYFDQQFWYDGFVSPQDFSDSTLNKYETANIQLLSNREEALHSGGYSLDTDSYSYAPVYDYIAKLYGQINSFYFFPDSDVCYLTSEDTQHLTLQEICYAKNEIYARRGRMFDSQELQDYFNTQSWYSGTIAPGSFKDSVFNSYEATNIQYLTKLENSLSDGKGYTLDAEGYDISAAGNNSWDDSWIWNVDYIFLDSDTRYLSREELANLSPQVLCYAKNEIYARRGRKFNSQELQNYFSSKSWYNGQTEEANFSTDIFNQYEASNVQLLKDFEFARIPGGYQLY